MRTRLDYASVASFERARRGETAAQQPGALFNGLLMAVFFVAVAGGVVLGASLYRSVVAERAAAEDARLEANLLAGAVRALDATDAVATADGPEGPALVLIERLDVGTFETRIYLHQGAIVQEYAVAGSELSPERATVLCASDRFTFDVSEDGLLTIRTSAGEHHVALRSAQGGGV